MIRIQRVGNETSLYEWIDENGGMWKRMYSLLGDFDIRLNEVEPTDLGPELREDQPKLRCHEKSGVRNIYCYDCNFDDSCPFEGKIK
jgi:hypothetical protein